jgi:hypothetical protein
MEDEFARRASHNLTNSALCKSEVTNEVTLLQHVTSTRAPHNTVNDPMTHYMVCNSPHFCIAHYSILFYRIGGDWRETKLPSSSRPRGSLKRFTIGAVASLGDFEIIFLL